MNMMNVHLPSVEIPALHLKAYQEYKKAVETETSGENWECLDMDGIQILDIFSQYGEKRGLFSEQTKKYQFADAIVFLITTQAKRNLSSRSGIGGVLSAT